MSTLASKVRALERHRRAVARELAELELGADIICANCTGMGIDFDVDCTAEGCANRPLGSADSGFTAHHAGPNCESTCTLCEGTGSGRAALALALALLTDQRQGFDVHAARHHARTLIGKGLDLTTGPEHDVWTDWRAWWAGKSKTPDECPATASGHGGQYARLGQRILDMLEGQPSECQGCSGRGWLSERPLGQGDRRTHESCHGTGHNLRGKLPGVEWSPAVRRKARESSLTRGTHRLPDWLGEALSQDIAAGQRTKRIDPETGGTVLDRRTRVCPRGEHRLLAMMPDDMDGRINKRGWRSLDGASNGNNADRRPLPKWLRGELEHA